MIRCASLAALCAFGLSNVAHASFALTQAGPTDVASGLITLGGGSLQFSANPLASEPLRDVLTGSDQGISTLTSTVGGSGSGGGSLQLSPPGSSLSFINLNPNTTTGGLFSQIVNGGNVTLTPGALTVISTPITGGGGSGNTITLESSTPGPSVTTPAPVPVEAEAPPLPLEGVIPPALPMPEPAHVQHAGMACSGAFSVTFGAQTTVNCEADLWFTKGFVTAGQLLQVNALGNILVDDVSFVAPVMQFNAGANFVTSANPLWFDGHATINALGANIAGFIQVSDMGSLTINSQTIAYNPPIPEPSTWALMGLGLVGLSLAARRKA